MVAKSLHAAQAHNTAGMSHRSSVAGEAEIRKSARPVTHTTQHMVGSLHQREPVSLKMAQPPPPVHMTRRHSDVKMY